MTTAKSMLMNAPTTIRAMERAMSRAPRITGFSAAIIAVLVSAVATDPAAAEDCSKAVAEAYGRQRAVSAMRQKTRMITERGPVQMTVDYLLPDRMHQRVKAVIDPAATETILIGTRAWVSNGQGWQPLTLEQGSELAEEVRKAVVEPPAQLNKYECAGKETIAGRELLAYRAVPEKGPGSTTLGTTYVDPVTGLPARTVMARAEKPDRPFFEQDTTYDPDIKIEPPPATK